jgi:hypothetical protein
MGPIFTVCDCMICGIASRAYLPALGSAYQLSAPCSATPSQERRRAMRISSMIHCGATDAGKPLATVIDMMNR